MEQRARTLMDTSINSFFGRIHPQGVGRRVPRYCVATLSLAALRARSLHVYLSDMLRRFLRGSLRCPRDTVGYTASPMVRERGAAGLHAPNASHCRVRPAIPQK